jgi:integrase
MRTKRFTALAVENFKPKAERYEVTDSSGLILFVGETGHKGWGIRYRRPDSRKPAKFMLGSWPAMSLAQARVAAATAKLDVSRGADPSEAKKRAKAEAKTAATNAAADTVERWAEEFLREHVRKKTRQHNQRQAEHVFHNIVIPRWRGRTVHIIARRDIKEVVREVAATRPTMANRTLGHLSKFFRWLTGEDIITGSPCLGIERPAPEVVRDRVLSDREVRAFWEATNKLPAPFGDIYKLLLLSAARRQEVAEMQWREIHLTERIWTIPSERSKSKLANTLPLSPQAWSIVEHQRRIVGSDYVFGHRRTGFSHMKDRLDDFMKPETPWRTHDLRRTGRSLLSRARVPSDIAELMLGHLLPGMRRVYDRHKYLDEKRAGFERLEREVNLILNPLAADVIPLRR